MFTRFKLSLLTSLIQKSLLNIPRCFRFCKICDPWEYMNHHLFSKQEYISKNDSP